MSTEHLPRRTKLILVDGLPGSGKSSTAQFIQMQLQRHQVPSRCLFEFQSVSAACLTREGSHREAVESVLRDWRRLAEEVPRSGEVVVMEAGWFQRTLGYFLLFGLSRGAMTDYMQRAESAIAGLHPALIYLHATDAERAYELARTCRPARWFAETNAWIASLPYGRGGRSGEEPLARFLRDARVLLDRFYARSRLRKIALDVSSAAWPATYETIGDFLSLPMVRSGAPSRSSLRKYEGCYVLRRRPEQMEIRLGRDGVLVASFESWLPLVRLLPVRAGVFLAAGFPVEMAFRVSRLGVVRSVALRVAPGQEIPGWSLLDKTFQRRV